ncbi:fimbrillin family protein [Dysgonomonas sp. GY75]|uniref:fimbrillin family protein n=1 Tax=Dysgonomonas sp. GY75 TaxID=2780419 RepID=UPI0018833FED|nr:fimbrillin family protein [Dysgonomonas sp. GY75]MBF0647950.1 fimbrillin family protein [Dysgonomonas sp. GY75]
MKSIRKLFYLPALMLALLSSCTDDGSDDSKFTNGREISFATWTDRQVKASVTTQSTLTSFTVAAWGHPVSADYDSYVLNGVTVTRGEGGSTSTWEYFPKASWPAEGQVDFFAYAPASSVNITTGLKAGDVSGTPATGGPVISYTVPGFVGDSKTAAQQEDLLVAKSTNLANSADPVQLNFKHALSRVVFKAKNQNLDKTYVIKELALTNLYSKGTLDLKGTLPDGSDPIVYQPVGTGGYQTLWSGQAESHDYKVDLGSTQVHVPYSADANTFTDITNASNGLMVLPQQTTLGEFSGASTELGLETDIVTTDASYLKATIAVVNSDNVVTDEKTFYFRLHDPYNYDDGIVFEAGRQYTFQLKLGVPGMAGYGIDFSLPTVSDFDNEITQTLPTPQPATTEYSVGAPYTVDGLNGVVYATTPEGTSPSRHGYAIVRLDGAFSTSSSYSFDSWATDPYAAMADALSNAATEYPFYNNIKTLDAGSKSSLYTISPAFSSFVGKDGLATGWLRGFPIIPPDNALLTWFKANGVESLSTDGTENYYAVPYEPMFWDGGLRVRCMILTELVGSAGTAGGIIFGTVDGPGNPIYDQGFAIAVVAF